LALQHFKSSVAALHEIQPISEKKESDGLTWSLFKLWSESTHPSPERRYARVLEDLEKWEWADGRGMEGYRAQDGTER
jgi:hypothetical protein